MATDYRSRDCEVGITFRCSAAERELLRGQARSEGYLSIQQLMEARMLGAAKPRRKSGPQQSHRDAEELPLKSA